MVGIIPMASSIRPSLSSLRFYGAASSSFSSCRYAVFLPFFNLPRRLPSCHIGSGIALCFLPFPLTLINCFDPQNFVSSIINSKHGPETLNFEVGNLDFLYFGIHGNLLFC